MPCSFATRTHFLLPRVVRRTFAHRFFAAAAIAARPSGLRRRFLRFWMPAAPFNCRRTSSIRRSDLLPLFFKAHQGVLQQFRICHPRHSFLLLVFLFLILQQSVLGVPDPASGVSWRSATAGAPERAR